METRAVIESIEKIITDLKTMGQAIGEAGEPKNLKIFEDTVKKLEKLEKWETHYFNQVIKNVDFTPRTPQGSLA